MAEKQTNPALTWVQKVKLALRKVREIQASSLSDKQKEILVRAAKLPVVHERKKD